MPSRNIFGWDLDISQADLSISPVGLNLMTPNTHTYSDPTDNFISGLLDFDESVDGAGTLLVLGGTLNLEYTAPGGGPTIGPVAISGHIVVTSLGQVIFIPEDPDALDPDLLSGDFDIVLAELVVGVDDSFEICFVAGTSIQTKNGPRLIEELKIGDFVQTMDNGLQPIRWIHSNTVLAHGNVAPIRIAEGALGNDRDLWVSPQHRMSLCGWHAQLLFDEAEVLATAKSLINDSTIRQQSGGHVTYYHFLIDLHEIVFANGAPSESFLPGQTGMGSLEQKVQDEIYTLFPELRTNLETYGAAARVQLKNYEGKALSELMYS